MLSSMGLEVMNFTDPELSWKPVTKGRRTKKSLARSLNSVVKSGNSTSPKSIDDLSWSDSDKLGEVIIGQETTDKSENVPLKKRRHLLQSPPSHPWKSSLRNQVSAPSRTRSCLPLFGDREQLQYPSCSSGDFSGIELLAAAASMVVDINDADKKDVTEDPILQNNSDESSSATLSEQGSKNKVSAGSLSNFDVLGATGESQDNNSAVAPQSLLTHPEDDTMPKVSREHWDLNTLMDAWGEPCDDANAVDTLKDVNGGMHREEVEKHFANHVLSKPTKTADGTSSLLAEEDKSTLVSEDGMCNAPPHLEENLWEPPNVVFSHTAIDTSNQSCEKDPESIQASNCESGMKILNQDTSSDIIVGCSPSCELVPEEKNNATTLHDGDSSGNISGCERSAALDGSHTGTDEVNAHDRTASESVIYVQPKDKEVSKKMPDLPVQCVDLLSADGHPVASTDSNKQIDRGFLSNPSMADCEQYSELAELGTDRDGDSNLPKEQLKRTVVDDTCKSFGAGTRCKVPFSVGSVGRCNLDVSRGNHVDMGDGDDLTGFQEGCDSPYEDGELRGSCFYSWEESDVENECVDYESDGRNGDGSVVDDYYHGSEIVEGGSEGSHDTQRNLSMKISPEGKSKCGAVNRSLKEHIVKDRDNNELAGKGLNAGSGSTVEQCVEMAIEANDGITRSQLHDHKDAVNARMTQIEEYVSKTVRGKLQSRIEGRSSTDGTDVKDVFSVQQSRSCRVAGSYPQPERDASPDRYLGRHRSAVTGERDGAHQWTSWGSRRCYTSNYQGGEGRSNTRPRSKTGEYANRIDGVEYHEKRQANYLAKGLHKPFVRRSPVERDEYFVVGRRVPLTQGLSNFRGRGHYSQRPGRDFAEEFEPLPEVAGASVRMPRYISRREHSFSPSSGRQTHMAMSRKRSRSRSRTRSPRAWHQQRECILGARRISRSPDFRSEARMERMRMPFSKSSFATEYGEGYISPPRGHFSPQRSCRWVEERNFADSNYLRRRRSPPVREFRRTQTLDAVGSSGRMKSDKYFRPMTRPGRFSFMANDGRECKLEPNYSDRWRDDSGEISHRVVHPGDGAIMRRFRHNVGGYDFEVKKLNNEEGDGDVPKSHQQQQGEREDKKASFKI
ncbi:uncharacterized protein LOC125211035 isoform X1 [Salvia hispanica]|uniref:uncharacterized protein LOC125211035 isoform X1 n=1 Tax=Salvia hispanica TaxID=49212 RepID=UPI0020093628|nr:uncharacterized protein LOC125211035 isoform X1 [Salvia hispanica]XP_047966668.1 uncharacterized protein LOC125211035 isoform X1 [Salvia hispanica]XP_047966669.1 uncharacterized protein LOC125211035 isoform X1 [Salvia hispanica]